MHLYIDVSAGQFADQLLAIVMVRVSPYRDAIQLPDIMGTFVYNIDESVA